MVVVGPDKFISSGRAVEWAAATTWSEPKLSLNAGTNSEPICPAAPVTRMFLIMTYPFEITDEIPQSMR